MTATTELFKDGLAVIIIGTLLLGGMIVLMPSASVNVPVSVSQKNFGPRGGEKIAVWDNTKLFTDSMKLDGVEVGDADNDGKTDMVVCGLSGVVTHIEKNGGTWVSTELWSNPKQGEQITPDIGDVDPDKPGNEIVVGGMDDGAEADSGAGSVDMIYHDGTAWKRENLYVDTHLVHGLTIGDLDPDIDGSEIVSVGFSYNCTMIYKESGVWKNKTIYTDDGKIKKNIIDDFDPDHAGNEMVIVSKAQTVTMVYKDGTTWKNETMYTANAGVSRVCVGDLDPTSPGKEVVVGADDGEVILIKKSGGVWTGVSVFKETMAYEKNRGVWIGDVDSTHSKNELVATGYSGNVTLIWGSGNSWSKKQIYQVAMDPEDGKWHRLHDVRIGNFDPDHGGNEIVIVGYDKAATEIMSSDWRYKSLYTDPQKLDGVELGDADNDGKLEAVICGLSGIVTMVEWEDGIWKSTEIWDNQKAGEMITPDIGDIDPDHAGNEIVVGGMSQGAEADSGEGSVDMIYLDGGTWKSENLFKDTHLVHGTSIGDLDPDIPGSEVIAVGFSYNVNMIYKKDGDWVNEIIYTDAGKIKKGIVGDFDSAHPGNELVVVSKAKTVTEVYKEDGVWKNRTLYTSEDGVSRVCIGDVDPANPGNEILAGDDGGRGILIRGSGDSWTADVLIKESEKNRGVWIGDIDPGHEGNEMVITGYTGTFNMFFGSGALWTNKVIYQDPARVHDIRFGDLDPNHEGNEILMVGYSKEVTMIYKEGDFPDQSFDLSLGGIATNFTLDPMDRLEVPFKLTAINGFDQVVSVSVSGIPEFMNHTLFPQYVRPSADGILTITHPVWDQGGSATVKITAHYGDITKEISFDLEATKDTVAPTITSTYPEPEEFEFESEEVLIEVVFSEPMKTVEYKVMRDGKEYNATGIYHGSNHTLILSNFRTMDGEDLPRGKQYTVTVSGEDAGGNAVTQDIIFQTEDINKEERINWISVGVLIAIAVVLFIIIIILYLRGRKELPMEEKAQEEKEDEEEEEKEKKPKKKGGKGKKKGKKGKKKEKGD